MSRHAAGPPIIANAADLLARFDVLLVDVWGVMHDGRQAYAAAGDALSRYRAGGGTVILLSNSPAPSDIVACIIADKHVRRDAWDAIVSSGDLALAHVRARGFRAIYPLGPFERDRPLFERLPGLVPLEAADAIVCSGLNDDRHETGETYRPVLGKALARRLPLVCANPDLMVDVGGALLPCAGAIASIYEDMGGTVHWAGKPHAPAYEAALDTAMRLRDSEIDRRKVLAVGDALRTDIAGALAFGLDALFIAQGIHRGEVMDQGRIDADKLARLFEDQTRLPEAAMIGLAW